MESNKVSLPKEVSNAIERLKGSGVSNEKILYSCLREEVSERHTNTFTVFIYSKGNFDTLLQALVNGYEVEQTPEDKVRDFHDSFTKTVSAQDYFTGKMVGKAIADTLTMLNIKITGVNDHE